MPVVSVVIVAYKAVDALQRCLESLVHLPLGSEVIIVDNDSGPDMHCLAEQYSQYHWVWNAHNLGYAPAANLGAALAQGDSILFLNPDTVLFPGSVQPLLHCLDRGTYGAVGPLSLFAAGWQNLLYHLPQSRITQDGKDGKEILRLLGGVYASKSKSVKLLVGFCLLISKKVFDALGGMDANLVLGLDDLDLSWRLREAGYELGIALDSYVFHQGQQSFGEKNTQKAHMEKASHDALSLKLIQYYGSASQVPSSWDLWEVDWFTLNTQLRGTTMHLRDELGIAVEWESLSPANRQALLEQFSELGIETRQILFLGHGDLPEGAFALSSSAFDAGLWNLAQNFWSGFAKVLYVRSAKIPLGHALQFALNHPGHWSMDAKNRCTPAQAQAFVLELGAEWPETLQLWTGPELYGQDFDPAVALPLLDIGPAQIRNLAQKLRQMRLDGVTEILLDFDNALVMGLDENPFAAPGLSFYDVERELNVGGWSVEEMGGAEVRPSVNHPSLEIKREGRFEWEQILETHERLRLRARAIESKYNLDVKVSFVILALNKVEYTRQCIESIQAHCRQNYELILVDNGSTDQTLEYFHSVPGAVVIHNPENLGVSAGWNQGIARASGDYVLIFNNDTLVPPMAIENLVRAAMNYPRAGIIAPRSNQIAGPQLLRDFPEFQSLDALFNHLTQRQQQSDLSAWQFPRIKGFCMLIPKAVIEDVGVFDESFGFGNFEDDDYSLRVSLAGYQLLVADDSIIFHYGSVSFDQTGIDWNEQMVKNHKIFNQKWARGRLSLNTAKVTDGAAVEEPSWTHSSADVPLLLQKAAQSVSESKLSEALGYYCRALEYGFSLEILDPLEKLIKDYLSPDESEAALKYLVSRFPVLEGGLNQGLSAPVGWVEEAESLLRAGNLDGASRLLARLGPEQLKSFAALNLQGILAYYRQAYDRAFDSFEKALKIQPTHENCLLNFYDAGLRLRQFQRVKDVLERALALDPGLDEVRRYYEELCAKSNFDAINPENMIYLRERNLQVEKLLKEGLWDKAMQEVLHLLGDDPHNERAHNNLGLIYWYKGEIENAWDCFETSARCNLLFADALVNLYDAAIVLGRLDAFLPLFEKALSASPYQPELRELDKHLRMGTLPERLHHYFEQRQYGQVVHSTLADAKSYLELQDYPRAIACFLKVIEGDDQSSDAFNGLGLANWYRQAYGDAFLAFRRAAEIKPHDGDILSNLWDAAKACGRHGEIRSVLENAVLVDPSLVHIKDLLEGEVWL